MLLRLSRLTKISPESTLALAFFRFIMTSGSIVIDGLDINTLVLEEVRRRLTIIAQDATLFSGTIRSNLVSLECYCLSLQRIELFLMFVESIGPIRRA